MQGYELTDFEWNVIAPLLPNKPRGVPRVDDRRVTHICCKRAFADRSSICRRVSSSSPTARFPTIRFRSYSRRTIG
jgi:hypothetical protein